MSHLGRPVEGQPDIALSLKPVADYLSKELSKPVGLLTDLSEPGSDGVFLLENVRFNQGEKADGHPLFPLG